MRSHFLIFFTTGMSFNVPPGTSFNGPIIEKLCFDFVLRCLKLRNEWEEEDEEELLAPEQISPPESPPIQDSVPPHPAVLLYTSSSTPQTRPRSDLGRQHELMPGPRSQKTSDAERVARMLSLINTVGDAIMREGTASRHAPSTALSLHQSFPHSRKRVAEDAFASEAKALSNGRDKRGSVRKL